MIDRTSRVAALLGGLATLVITVAITLDVGSRWLYGQPLLWVDEVSSFLLVLVIFGGVAHAFRTGGHVRVDLLTAHLPPSVRAWLRVVTLALGIALLTVVIWVTAESARTAHRYGRVSAVMLYPNWIPMLVIPAGLALMAVAMLSALVQQVRVALGPRATRDEVAPASAE